jgi:hypothetical protein
MNSSIPCRHAFGKPAEFRAFHPGRGAELQLGQNGKSDSTANFPLMLLPESMNGRTVGRDT